MAFPLGTVIRALSAFSILFPHLVLSKVYRRCELAQELRNVHGISMNDLPTWICIAQHESQFDTSAKNAGSGDHGIFQISEIYWCSATGEGLYACGLPCSAFQDDDITDDVECAKKIYNEHTKITGDGYNAWTAYANFCKNSTRLPLYIVGCFDEENVIQYGPEEVKSFEGFRKASVRQPPRYPDHPRLQFLKVAAYAHQKLMFDPPLITTAPPPNAFNTFIETSENEVKSQGKQVYAMPRGYSTPGNSYSLQNNFRPNYQTQRFNDARNFPTTLRPVYRGRSRIYNQFYPSETEAPLFFSYPTTRIGRTRNIFQTTFPYSPSYFLDGRQNFEPDFYDSYVEESRIDSVPFQQQISEDVLSEKSLVTESSKHHHRPIKIKHKFTLKFTPSVPPSSQFSSLGTTYSSSSAPISSTSPSPTTPSSTTPSSTTPTTTSSSNSSSSNTSSSTSSDSTTTEKPSTDAETIETSSVSAGASSTPSSTTSRPIVSPVPVRPSEAPVHELVVTSSTSRPFKHKPIRTKRPLFGHYHLHHQNERSDGGWEILRERSSPSYKTLKSDLVTTTSAPTVSKQSDHFFIKPGTVFAHVNESGYLFSLKSNGFKFSSL